MRGLCSVALVLCLSISLANAQDLSSARDFVNKLYDAYQHPSCPYCPDTLHGAAKHIFSLSLLGLIRRDQRNHTGEAGALDFDPICACQDPDGLHVLKLEIKPISPNRAAADVLVGYAGTTKQAIRLSLLDTPQGWRVDDVSTKDEPSLRKLLK